MAKGSAKGFVVKDKSSGKHRAIITQDNREKQKPWASSISHTAHEKGVRMIIGPVLITLAFYMPRPKSHFGTGKNAAALKNGAAYYHTSTPDLDKLVRCVIDALTGIAWNDDSQVGLIRARKVYHHTPGVTIEISEAP